MASIAKQGAIYIRSLIPLPDDDDSDDSSETENEVGFVYLHGVLFDNFTITCKKLEYCIVLVKDQSNLSGYFISYFIFLFSPHNLTLSCFFKNDITTEGYIYQSRVDDMPINDSDQQQNGALRSNPGVEHSSLSNSNQPASTSEPPNEETPQHPDISPSTYSPAYR